MLLGPVQAGKTTLMRVLAGLDHPTTGRLLEDGRDVTGLDGRRRSVAMVHQQFINDPSFTVGGNIASPLKLAGLNRAAHGARVQDVAGRLGLSALLGRLPAELSGGQQQRTALARALVKNSRLLLLDEPLVNLDYKLREDLRAEMRDRRLRHAVRRLEAGPGTLTQGGGPQPAACSLSLRERAGVREAARTKPAHVARNAVLVPANMARASSLTPAPFRRRDNQPPQPPLRDASA